MLLLKLLSGPKCTARATFIIYVVRNFTMSSSLTLPLEQALPLHVQQLGEQGSWVLVVHGLFGDGNNLGSLGRALAERHRVLLVDLRNHGRSPHADDCSLLAMAADLAALQQRFDTGPCAVVGHSLGGKVAMQLALADGGRINRLVVADIAPVTYPEHHQPVFEALHSVDLTQLTKRADAEQQLAQLLDDAGLRGFLMKSLVRDEDGRFRWRMNIDALQRNYGQFTVAPQGASWPGPTLFIRGGNSNYIRTEHDAVMRTLFPAYELLTVEGAGHWVHGERPAEFNRLVCDFLNRG